MKIQMPTRLESEVFSELGALCRKPGYIHAIAYFCYQNNFIRYKDELNEANLEKDFSSSCAVRNEINTLLGLMIKAEIDWRLPAPKILQEYIDTSERLLLELHQCLAGEFLKGATKEAIECGAFNPFKSGAALREPIFYSGESAYDFQYLDFAPRKYAKDAPWLRANCGFTIEQVSIVATALGQIKVYSYDAIRKRMWDLDPDKWTMLPLFVVQAQTVASKSGLSIELVQRILGAFTLDTAERNAGFNSLHDFNVVTAAPLFRMPSGEFLSFQSYSFAQAIYEAPFYWMAKDKGYLPTLAKNRGDFTEDVIADRLALVFGAKHVYQNVDIIENKAKKVSEIDILVIWANRVIVVQSKSKRLTLDARKGSDQVIRDDFTKAVQDAYNQGALSAQCLMDKRYKFVTKEGFFVEIPKHIKEIYLFCVVSDHYPALSFQVREFLQTQAIERLQPPLVMDIFALDAITEMLQSPLQFLSYIYHRAKFDEQLTASDELTILGFHLNQNLWIEPRMKHFVIGEDYTSGLDIAMQVRRTGIKGAETPDGILTRLKNTTLGRILKEIENRPDPDTVDIGFLLLGMCEQTFIEASHTIDKMASRTRFDGQIHDASFAFSEDCSGITFHCTDEPLQVALSRLEAHCKRRKYKEKATIWGGLCLSSRGPNVRFGVFMSYPWRYNPIMDENTRDMPMPMSTDQAIQELPGRGHRAKRVGRNDPCPCGSGLKYKKCCGK